MKLKEYVEEAMKDIIMGTAVDFDINLDKDCEVSKSLLTCSNVECESHGKKLTGRFCTNCGSEIITIYEKTKSKVNINSALEDFGGWDSLWPVDVYKSKHDILLPNRRGSLSLSIDDDTQQSEFKIPNEEESILHFSNEYRDFIEYLKLNDFDFEIKFGVITYWN